ncbi:hypothetical protein EZS27_043946, partial [termite gut metagenome]
LIVRFKGDLLHGCCVLFPMLRYTVVAKVTNQKEAAHFLDSLFKREQYCIQNNSSNKTDEFIKDIICFANTIREETAYILLGISCLPRLIYCGNNFD